MGSGCHSNAGVAAGDRSTAGGVAPPLPANFGSPSCGRCCCCLGDGGSGEGVSVEGSVQDEVDSGGCGGRREDEGDRRGVGDGEGTQISPRGAPQLDWIATGTVCSAVECVCGDCGMWWAGLLAGCGRGLRGGVGVLVSGGESFWCGGEGGWDCEGQERGSEGAWPGRRGEVVPAAPSEGGGAGGIAARHSKLAVESNFRGVGGLQMESSTLQPGQVRS